jgi:hypothetical protein
MSTVGSVLGSKPMLPSGNGDVLGGTTQVAAAGTGVRDVVPRVGSSPGSGLFRRVLLVFGILCVAAASATLLWSTAKEIVRKSGVTGREEKNQESWRGQARPRSTDEPGGREKPTVGAELRDMPVAKPVDVPGISPESAATGRSGSRAVEMKTAGGALADAKGIADERTAAKKKTDAQERDRLAREAKDKEAADEKARVEADTKVKELAALGEAKRLADESAAAKVKADAEERVRLAREAKEKEAADAAAAVSRKAAVDKEAADEKARVEADAKSKEKARLEGEATRASERILAELAAAQERARIEAEANDKAKAAAAAETKRRLAEMEAEANRARLAAMAKAEEARRAEQARIAEEVRKALDRRPSAEPDATQAQDSRQHWELIARV